MSKRITIDQEVIGGKPRVKGTRVSVEQIYEMHKVKGMSPRKIADALPTVGEGEAREAIEYAEEHEISGGESSKRLISKN